MALTHPLLLLGLVLAGIPVILHLMLRAQPKKLLFPALRLIQHRRKQNVQRLRLRHILLMALRILAIALLVFGIARPKVPAGDYAPSGFDLLRFAAVLAVLLAAYLAVSRWWRTQRLPAHTLEHRRSMLRYALGVLGVILFLAVVGWPYGRRVVASIADPKIKAGEDVPVAAVLLFDTSLSMQYRLENKTRLDVAKEIAGKHLSGFPSGSRAAVADTSGDVPIRLQSITAAQTRLAQVELHTSARTLNDRLEAALQTLWEDRERLMSGESGPAGEQFAREIYIFTDLTAAAWRLGESPRLQQLLKQLPGVHVYLIDVGVPGPQNLGLTNLSLSDQSPSLGSDLTVRATLESTGVPAGEKIVQIFFENDNGKLVDKGKRSIKIVPGQPVLVTFTLSGLSGTAKQGELKIAASDPLAFDDALRFTVLVQPPPKVLVVSDSKASSFWLRSALAPEFSVRLGKAKWQCKEVTTDEVASERLTDYAAVWLVNVQNPSAIWKKLGDYVRQGGGLGIIVGDRLVQTEQHYFEPEARDLLPGLPIRERAAPDGTVTLDLHDMNHPVHAYFQDYGVAQLTAEPILKYYIVEEVKEARILARFTAPRSPPALLSRAVGDGQVLLLATAIDTPLSVAGDKSWNSLATSGWMHLAWLDQMTKFLSQAKAVTWNHTAGSDVSVALPETPVIERYLLRKPSREQLPGDVPPKATNLVLRELTELGNYRVISMEPKIERGFSINADPAESKLARLRDADLKEMLPEDRFSVAKSVESLDRKVRDGRIGREIYPLVVLFLAFVFVSEQLVANLFYAKVSTS